jgi:hypothetical protein
LLSLWLLSACNPYEGFGGNNFYAGPIDSTNFPAVYQGNMMPGKPNTGTFTAASGFANGNMVQFYTFPSAAVNGTDPTVLVDTTAAVPISVLPAYVFDPAPPSPFPAADRCVAPPGYVFNLQVDSYPLNIQSNIFVQSPDGNVEDPATFTISPGTVPYVPVVQEVPVTSMGENCQSYQNQAVLLGNGNNVAVPEDPLGNPVPDGKFLAWAIIDPGADVNPMNMVDFFGPGEHFGWYHHFLVAYLDGGYIPTTTTTTAAGSKITANTQKIYVPTMVPGGTMPNTMPGSGFDVFDAGRADAGYSPLCDVVNFVPSAAQLASAATMPTSAAQIPAAAQTDTMTLIYCLLVQP